ncbi:hypothetical protein [Sinorhizobium chiapasense]|uniref:Uncharacterized protein n=1 Tax=Sinorhizobium chiapasense TaxID=501572 RepID=A0ABZ2B4Q8_9HYPH
MISTLTILSLDQGNIYAPPPDRGDETTTVEGPVNTPAAEPPRASMRNRITAQFQTVAAVFLHSRSAARSTVQRNASFQTRKRRSRVSK